MSQEEKQDHAPPYLAALATHTRTRHFNHSVTRITPTMLQRPVETDDSTVLANPVQATDSQNRNTATTAIATESVETIVVTSAESQQSLPPSPLSSSSTGFLAVIPTATSVSSNEAIQTDISSQTQSQSTTFSTSISSSIAVTDESVQSSTSSVTTESGPSETVLGTSACERNENCEERTIKSADHKAEIAGAVVGMVAFGLFIFIGRLLFRRYRRMRQERDVAGRAIWPGMKQSSSDTSSWFKHRRGKSTATQMSSSVVEERDKDHGFREPGPAVPSLPSERYLQADHHSQRSDSTVSQALEDFRRPLYAHLGQTNEFTRSKIGLALSRYSSIDMITTPLISASASRSASPVKTRNSQLEAPAVVAQIKRISRENIKTLHKRSSSISASSEAQTFFIGRAKAARRHSLTPRIINIVANSTSNESIIDTATVEGSTKRGSHRSSRARSVSPPKHDYEGSPAKLKSHFGVEIWGRNSGRTSSERQGIERSESLKEHAAHNERENESISYPALGRTMSEVKRTIRAHRDRAVSDASSGQIVTDGFVEQMPESVTISRPGKATRNVRP